MLRRNVLIFHNAALGDFVTTWPIAMAVGRVLAQSRIIYVTASHKGQLAERAISVEYSDIENGWHALHGESIDRLPDIPARLTGAMQMAIVFSLSPEDAIARNLRAMSGERPVLHVAPKPPAGVHVWRHHLDQLASMPVLSRGVEQVQQLIRTRGLLTRAAPHPDRVIIHPGSGAPRKNWPIENFVALARLLGQAGREVIVTLGEVERETFDRAAIDALAKAATLRQCDSMLDLFDTLADAGAYVGNDSGPTHLAAMLGRRVVALFGPTSDAAAWAPVGPHTRVMPFEAAPAQVADTIYRA